MSHHNHDATYQSHTLKLTFWQYPAIHTNYIISHCTSLHYLPFTIYHQGIFHSVRRNPSLNCLHRRRSLAILGHAGPRWRIRLSLHLVLGHSCRLVNDRGVYNIILIYDTILRQKKPEILNTKNNELNNAAMFPLFNVAGIRRRQET